MRSTINLLLCACALRVCAQAPPTVHLRTEVITVDDGLPQDLVHTMLQERQGFLWMGTKDGLARYDAYHFMVFRNDAADSRSPSEEGLLLCRGRSHQRAHGQHWCTAAAGRGVNSRASR